MSLTASLLLTAQAALSPTCDRLLRDFASNEVTFSIIDTMYQSVIEADDKFQTAIGGYKTSPNIAKKTKLAEEYRLKGDRLTTLLQAQGCPVPDHLTSADTYRQDLATCSAAKGMPTEKEACAYIDRTMANYSPKPTPYSPPRQSFPKKTKK